MTLKALTFADYLVGSYNQQASYDACKFVKCVKGEPFGGYANISYNGQRLRITGTVHRLDAITFFAKAFWNEWDVSGHRLVIPVPSSKTHIGNPTPSPVFDIAKVLEREAESDFGVHACDCLAWKHPIPSAHHQGGSRDPATLYDLLSTRKMNTYGLKHAILIDDVKTTGGHLKACAAFLQHRLGIRVSLCLCVGRRVATSSEHQFGWDMVQMEEFVP